MKYTIIISILLHYCLALKANATIPHRYESIFNYGDSLSNLGNFLLTEAVAFPAVAKLPYGGTFFRHPTGHFSDGCLMIDFIAEALGLPHLKSYLELGKGSHHARSGVNFAVAGATALDSTFFSARDLGSLLWTNHSLSVQLDWLKKLRSSLCTTQQDCDTYFKKSLFLVREIGGNDYNFPFTVGASVELLRSMVPVVVAITNATSLLIEEGAVELVVPGNFPIRCWMVYLALFQSPNESDYYPRTGCLKAYEFASYHNSYLKRELQILRQKYGHARIMYADYYGAAMRFFLQSRQYGFYGGTQAACCGGVGPYNFNLTAMCGSNRSTLCTDPSAVVNWDGIHLTEAAYRHILYGPFASPRLIVSKSQPSNALASILFPKMNLCSWS